MSDAVDAVANWVISRSRKPATEEPCFIDQTIIPSTANSRRREWIDRCLVLAKVAGCDPGVSVVRISHHPDDHDVLLFEAWKVMPANQGEPRFKFTWQRNGKAAGWQPPHVTNAKAP